MNYLSFELFKILNKKWTVLLLVATTILLPFIIRTVSNLAYSSNEVTEGQFLEMAALGFISFSTSYIGIPVWIIFIIGIEFSNGHASKVIFYKSRKHFFLSKISYSLLVSCFFTLLGLLSMFIVHLSATFSPITSVAFYLGFLVQCFITFFSISLVLMSLIFFIRNPVIGFVVYLIITTLEGMTYVLFSKLYSTKLFLLPFHLAQLGYLKNGEMGAANYYNPFLEFYYRILFLPIFLSLLLFLTYILFNKKDLKALSD